jgi:23S rRNA (adenine2030-N6)-methyltransferase
MNYRHAFHAGNHGDVLKHVLLMRVLAYLTQKDAALAVLDAHAGISSYDLSGVEALKTGEWRGGVGALLSAELPAGIAALLSPYLSAVPALNAEGTLRHYPGSPVLARSMLRRVDRLILNELHPADYQTLFARFRNDLLVRVTSVDAAQAVKAALPFKEKRGLVLIDPAFEVTDETIRVARMVEQALRRMANLCMIIWYPVTTRAFADGFVAALAFPGAKSVLRAELLVREPAENGGLAGSGVVIVNPPWTLQEEAGKILPALAAILGEGGQGRYKLEWLVKPT